MSESATKVRTLHPVKSSELPAACPPPGAKAWSMHPRVFLKFNSDGQAKCPYCGAYFKLED